MPHQSTPGDARVALASGDSVALSCLTAHPISKSSHARHVRRHGAADRAHGPVAGSAVEVHHDAVDAPTVREVRYQARSRARPAQHPRAQGARTGRCCSSSKSNSNSDCSAASTANLHHVRGKKARRQPLPTSSSAATVRIPKSFFTVRK